VRSYRVFAYKASLGELWRFSGKRVAVFMVALLLKVARSPKLVFEQPDFSEAREIPLGEVPAGVRAEVAGLIDEIRACGFEPGPVKRLESDSNLAFGLFFTGPARDRYLPLLVAVAPKDDPKVKLVRYALVSFDDQEKPVLTTYFPPQCDPDPLVAYMLAWGKGIAALDRLHTQVLSRHPRPAAPVTPQTVGEAAARMEELSYAHLHRRGVYSEKIDR